MPKITMLILTIVIFATAVWSQGSETAVRENSFRENTSKAEDKEKKKPHKRGTIKLAEDQEEPPPPERDPATYQLSNPKLLEEYTRAEVAPYDRGEHMFIAALFGGIGGGVVGGLTGLSQYDKDNAERTRERLYTFTGIGIGAGAVLGITTTFFERGKIEQFAIGKFLLRYSWYGSIGGALLGTGVGFIPYSASRDSGDLVRYAGYGAGAGLALGLLFFAIDLPGHLRLYSLRRAEQDIYAIAWYF